MEYPKSIVSNQKEESISIQRVEFEIFNTYCKISKAQILEIMNLLAQIALRTINQRFYTVCYKLKQSLGMGVHQSLDILACDPLISTMNHHRSFVSNQIEESICLQKVRVIDRLCRPGGKSKST